MAGNLAWTVLGLVVPTIAALVALPLLTQNLGIEKVGVLSLLWILIGYFTVFDFGIGQALTRDLARLLSENRSAEAPTPIWTAALLSAALSTLFGATLYAAAPHMANIIGAGSPDLEAESATSIRLVALSLPAVAIATSLNGTLAAFQRFELIALARIPNGAFTFLAPLFASSYSENLALAAATLPAVRALYAIFLFVLVLRTVPHLGICSFSRRASSRLLGYGGWLSVSGMVGPAIMYIDRFILAITTSPRDVGFYAVPSDTIARIGLLAGAAQQVLFPAFSSESARDPKRALRLLQRSGEVLVSIHAPIAAGLYLFAPELLELWLGHEFSVNSSIVVQLGALALLTSALARGPFTYLASTGQARSVALLHLFEILPYVIALWYFSTKYGLVGAAAVSLSRVCLDAAFLIWLVQRQAQHYAQSAALQLLAISTITVALGASSFFGASLFNRSALCFLVSAIAAVHLGLQLRSAYSR